MNLTAIVLSVLPLDAGGGGESWPHKVMDIDWASHKPPAAPGVSVLPPEAGGAGATVEVICTDPNGGTFRLLSLQRPTIRSLRYAVRGRVRYEGVRGRAYLEMWSSFAGGGRYFSRTLGEAGPMKQLTGSSPWREFVLPFYSNDKAGLPTELAVNVVLPGRGQVEVGALELAEGASTAGAWWTARQDGAIGAIGGVAIGLIGALVGTLGGLGRARRLVVALTAAVALAGAAALAVGVAALLVAQPYQVYYPLLLGGGICLAVFGSLLPVVIWSYRRRELQKMTAMDT